ncbi:hypothetical protein EIP86_002391 [Pleurotus ostreatoroseus]|nr:hypothetical protein EIP86_002391 [Pleurotus ostreatoroseus]
MARISKSSPSNEGRAPPSASQPVPPTRPPSPSAPVTHHVIRRTATQRTVYPVATRGAPLPPVLTIAVNDLVEVKSESPSPVIPGDPADWPPEMLERFMDQVDAQIEARRAAEARSEARARMARSPSPSPASSPVIEGDFADLPPHEIARIMGDIDSAADAQGSPSPTDTGTPPPLSESDNDTPPPPTRPASSALCDIPAEDLNLVLASFGAVPARPSTPQIVRDIANYSDEEVHQLMIDIGMIPGTPPTPRTPPQTVREAANALIHELHRSGMITPARSPVTALRTTLASTYTPLSVRTPRTTTTSFVTPPSSPPRASASVSTPTPTPASSRPHPLRGPTDTYFENGIPDRLRNWTRNRTSDMLYVVNKGRSIGIFDDWFLAKDQVDGFPNNGYKAYITPKDAWQAWARANLDGNTRGPVHPRSLVGKVRMRGNAGAPPPYTEN